MAAMSDFFTVIGDIDVAAVDAEATARRITGYLIERGYVQPQPSDCVYGRDPGYAPGPDAGDISDWIDHDLGINGIAVHARPVLHLLNRDFGMTCRACGRHADADVGGPAWPRLQADLFAWPAGDGAVACPMCGVRTPITDVEWDHDAVIAANVSLTLWNWGEVVGLPEELAALTGHRMRTHDDKL